MALGPPFPTQATTPGIAAACKGMEPAAPGRRRTLPPGPAVLHAWALFHAGEFQSGEAGLAAGWRGITAANRSHGHLRHLPGAARKTRLLFMQIAEACPGAHCRQSPATPTPVLERLRPGPLPGASAWPRPWRRGSASKSKNRWKKPLPCPPACRTPICALRHAEVIDKVGAMVGGMTYGAKKELACSCLKQRWLEPEYRPLAWWTTPTPWSCSRATKNWKKPPRCTNAPPRAASRWTRWKSCRTGHGDTGRFNRYEAATVLAKANHAPAATSGCLCR